MPARGARRGTTETIYCCTCEQDGRQHAREGEGGVRRVSLHDASRGGGGVVQVWGWEGGEERKAEGKKCQV